MASKSPVRLISIPMSHYCEKVRWGLERLGVEYFEERHLQIFHYTIRLPEPDEMPAEARQG